MKFSGFKLILSKPALQNSVPISFVQLSRKFTFPRRILYVLDIYSAIALDDLKLPVVPDSLKSRLPLCT
jgi:hypothetical protein